MPNYSKEYGPCEAKAHFFDLEKKRIMGIARSDGKPFPALPDAYFKDDKEIEMEACNGRAYNEVDPRFGIPLCRKCFAFVCMLWGVANRRAELCRCGRDPLPNQVRCRDCFAFYMIQEKASREFYKKYGNCQ